MTGSRMRTPPGVQRLAAEQYHADDICEQPSLSASIAHVLCTTSPRHAWTQHPRLNLNFERVDEDKFDVGTTAHALLLEGNANVVVVPADDWRTKAAKEAREAAREAGVIALLEKHWVEVRAMIAAVREQLDAHEATPTPFTDGEAERTLVWEERGVVCRARLDWLRDDLATIDDFKTTKASANPDKWTRTTLYAIGADLQVAMYLRGVRALFGVEPEFRFVVAETYPPYALSLVSLGPSALAFANKKLDYALKLWASCLRDDRWPSYDSRVAFAELPAWEESRWLERELREVAS